MSNVINNLADVKTKNVAVLYMPFQYLSEEASENDAEVLSHYRRRLTETFGENGFIILPLILDDNGDKLFELDVLSINI